MTLLLDTHCLLWLINSRRDIFGSAAVIAIEQADAVYYSSISVVEIQIKRMLGKLETSQDILQDLHAAGLQELPYGAASAIALVDFPGLARHDPFDRMLIAQASTSGVHYMTVDAVLLALKLPYVADARL